MQQSANPLRIGGICLEQSHNWERILWERAVPFFVLVYIGLNPFPHMTTISAVGYYSAAALLIFYFLRYRDWGAFKTPFTLPVAFFAGWAVFGLFWALDIGASLHDLRTHLFKYIVLFLLLTIFFNSRAKLRLLCWAIILSVLVSGFHDMYFFYVLSENSFLTRMAISDHQLPVGPLGFMALFALALAMYLLLLEAGGLWRKCVLTACISGLLVILFVTQMRSLLLAVPFVVAALFWDKKKILAAAMLATMVFSFFFFTKLRDPHHIGSYTDRLTINYMSLLLIAEHPLTGVGFSMETPGNHALIDHEALRGKVPSRFKNDAVEYNNPHNMWLDIAVRLGLVGLFIFISILIVGVRICFAAIGQRHNRELRLTGQLCLSLLGLFSVYGLFNAVFMHFFETLLCVLFAIISGLAGETQKRPCGMEPIDAVS